ncbi:ABC transporter permease [Streptosporangium sp. KLBMP 9127]
MMLLFVYVFGGAIDAGSVSYVNHVLPGTLLITIASGIAYTTLRLFLDMKSGIFERFQSMPIARSSGAVGARADLTDRHPDLARRRARRPPHELPLVGGSAGVARGRRHPDCVHPGVDVDRCHSRPDRQDPRRGERVLLPAHLPAVPQLGVRATDTMPGPVRFFAEHQPVTSIVNTIRALFTQQPVGTAIWIALAWCVGIVIVAYISYRHRIS